MMGPSQVLGLFSVPCLFQPDSWTTSSLFISLSHKYFVSLASIVRKEQKWVTWSLNKQRIIRPCDWHCHFSLNEKIPTYLISFISESQKAYIILFPHFSFFRFVFYCSCFFLIFIFFSVLPDSLFIDHNSLNTENLKPFSFHRCYAFYPFHYVS